MNSKQILIFSMIMFARAVYAHTLLLDPQVADFINKLDAQKAPPIYTLSPQDARAVLDNLQKHNVNILPALVQDITIPGKITPEISLRIVRPTHAKGKLPIIIYAHGDGWILGNKNTHDYLIRKIANGAQAAVVFINYDLSPEAKYPVAVEQIYEAAEYMAKNGAKHNLNGKSMAIAGDSVGGGMAAAVTLLAKQRGTPHLKYQVLFYPVTDANFSTPSYNEFANGPWLTKKAMQWFWDAYAPVEQRTIPTVAPLNATHEELKNLPPALIITDNDVLRDEGEAYALKLMQAGVPVTATRFLGTIHDFVMLAPLKDSQAANTAIELATSKLKKALEAR